MSILFSMSNLRYERFIKAKNDPYFVMVCYIWDVKKNYPKYSPKSPLYKEPAVNMILFLNF